MSIKVINENISISRKAEILLYQTLEKIHFFVILSS